jgi:large subunit ribosomal protein L27Ae
MRTFHFNKNAAYCPIVNLDHLWTLVPEAQREEAAARKDGSVPIIDVTRSVRTHFY